MTDVVIEPGRQRGEPEIAGPCLFFINPHESSKASKEAVARGAIRHNLFHSSLYELDDGSGQVWAGPAIGAPMAVMTLEKLIALGVDTCIVVGWCGSLQAELPIGTVLVPDQVISGEGTSAYYAGPDNDLPAADLSKDLFSYLEAADFAVQRGPVWSTDAPYREHWSKMADLRGQGVAAVDMEFSALTAAASFRGISLAGALLVSDEIGDHVWTPGFRHKLFRRQSRQLFECLGDFFGAKSS